MNFCSRRSLWVFTLTAICANFFCAARASAANPAAYFTIEVVDEQTGRGVPRAELETCYHVRFYTDSAGLVAFNEPGLMNCKVFFTVTSHGYEFPKDMFG